MEKKYNIVLGLMIFFFLIIVGVALAWGLGYIGINNNNVDTKDDNVVINEQEKNDNKMEEKIEIGQTLETDVINNNNMEKVSNINLFKLDSSKCLNHSEDIVKYNVYDSQYEYYEDCDWFTFKYDAGKFTLKLVKDGYVDKNRANYKINVEAEKEYEIKGVESNKVADVSINWYGHDFLASCICFLMEDGTVYYVEDVLNVFVTNNFTVIKAENISNVVKIIDGNIGGEEGGRKAVFAIRNDGYFYLLK